MDNIKYIIRELKEEDLKSDRGFLETLSNLSKTALLSQKKIREIFKEIQKKK